MTRTSGKTSAAHSLPRRRRALAPALTVLLTAAALTAGAQTGSPTGTPTGTQTGTPTGTGTPATDPATSQSTGGTGTQPEVQTGPTGRPITTRSSTKLNLAPTASYDNRYEVYGGVGFMNGQAGQALPKRFNLGTAEAMGTFWLTSHLGVAGDYRFAGGTTPVLSPYYNRVAVYEHIGMGGVQWRGPKGRYAAVDYHGFAGISHGIFDTAIKNYPGGSPVSATSIGLYTNRTKPFFALGGSVDFNYTRNIAIRLQPDLILEHFGTELREFVAVSGGVVYRFGKR